MPVFFSSLSISNFRSCADIQFELAPLTPIVGRNNCGKSNCISALVWLVRKFKLEIGDFRDPTLPVQVTGELTGITDEDLDTLTAVNRAKISPHVVGGKLSLRRIQTDAQSAPVLYLRDAESGDWTVNPSGIDQAIQSLLPEPIRIGAMEDAEEDSSKAKTSTTIGKLLSELLASIRDRHQGALNVHLDGILSQISAEGPNRFQELGEIDASINGKVADLFPGISVRLDFPVPVLDDLIKAGTVRVYEEGGPGRTFGSYGHGTQRAIQMALVRHLAELKRGQRAHGGATLLLIDEPELYLHPFAVEHVRDALHTLSKSGYQVVFSTHSAQMITSGSARDALILYKRQDGTRARNRIPAAVEGIVAEAPHQVAQLFTLTNSSQILFADRVVLAEGKTELRLLPFIFQSVSSKSLGQASIALVAQSGANDTRKSMAILDALGLPSVAIVDLDFAIRDGVKLGILDEQDANLAACKAALARLAASGEINLDPQSGLPTKKGPVNVTAAEAFELLASQEDAQHAIGSIVSKFREHGIWVWRKGAIEAHLSLDEKCEAAWSACQIDRESRPRETRWDDCPEMKELAEWMAA